MDEDRPGRRVGDGCHGRRELRAMPLDQLGIDETSRGDRPVCGSGTRVEVAPPALVELAEERQVHQLDGALAGRVVLALLVEPQVEHRADAVVDRVAPAGLGELPHAVRANHTPAARRLAVLGPVVAEIANVEAAVPGEPSRVRHG